MELNLLEEGQRILGFREEFLHEILIPCIQRYQPMIEAKGGELSLQFDPKVSALQLDITRFRNVSDNLLDNALKYSEGVPLIQLSSALRGNQVFIHVKDNERGISADDIPFVLDKFYRVYPYIVKPVDEEELIARIHVILRRTATQGLQRKEYYQIGEFKFFVPSKRLVQAHQRIHLTEKEAQLLEMLCEKKIDS